MGPDPSILPPEVDLILDGLGCREECRIDHGRAERRSDRPHRLADGIQEGRAGVLREMPAVGHLDSVRQRPRSRLGITTATIARDDLDLRVVGQPSLDGGDLQVRQQSQDAPTFEIADDRAVAIVAPERSVIDANDPWRIGRSSRTPSHYAKNSVVADGQHQPLGEARSWPATEREPKMMDDERRSDTCLEPLREGAEDATPRWWIAKRSSPSLSVSASHGPWRPDVQPSARTRKS